MSSVIKAVVVCGLILSAIGYFLPDNLAVGGVFIAGFMIGGAIFIIIKNKMNNSIVKFLPLVLAVLFTSILGSLGLMGICKLVIEHLPCTTNKIRALAFMNLTSPMLLALILWIQQYFYRNDHRK